MSSTRSCVNLEELCSYYKKFIRTYLMKINYFCPEKEESTLGFLELVPFVFQVSMGKPRFSLLAKNKRARKNTTTSFPRDCSRETKTRSTFFRGNHDVHNSCTEPGCFAFPLNAMHSHRTFLSNETFCENLMITSTRKRS